MISTCRSLMTRHKARITPGVRRGGRPGRTPRSSKQARSLRRLRAGYALVAKTACSHRVGEFLAGNDRNAGEAQDQRANRDCGESLSACPVDRRRCRHASCSGTSDWFESLGTEVEDNMASRDITSKIDEAKAKADALTARGADLLKEKANQVTDAASQVAARVIHSAQETAQKAVHRTQEAATAVQHRLEEKGIIPSDKSNQK